MNAYTSICVCVYSYMCACVYLCLCICVVYVHLYLSKCFRQFASRNITSQLCVSSKVQRGSVYKCITSASTFFNSICDIMNHAKYDALLTFLDILLSLQFISHYNSLDLFLLT